MQEDKDEMMETYISTEECASKKGVTRQAVVAAIKRGHLPALRIGGRYAIKPSDCEKYDPVIDYAERGKLKAGKLKKKEE